MKLWAALLTIFIAIPLLEFAILIEIGRRIGTLYTLLIVFGIGIVGAIIAKMEGLRILYKIKDNLREGIMPTDELFDGLLVLIAGAFLITPGILTDAAGLMLLFPPTRYPVKTYLRRVARRWIMTRTLRISM